MCLPHFDGEFPFAAILDADRGGSFRICPADEFTVERRYLPETNVLETTFRTSAGACVLRDLFTIGSEGQGVLEPEHELLREVEGLDGTVVLKVSYEPRRDYARAGVRLEERGPLGLACEAAGGLLSLISDVTMRTDDGGTRAEGQTTIEFGQRRYWSLTYNSEAPAASALLGPAARKRVEDTAEWWRAWAAGCTYDGPYREHVVRSALVLKLLTFAPSGAIVAAPTTSLPERPGGDRNWDYRYCWLRDAAFTVRALVQLGYHEEAEAFAAWMTHATALTHPRLQVLYDLFGESKLEERTLDHLDGYQGSRPVRIGNGAHSQLQLDIYGEVTKSFRYCAEAGLAIPYTAEGFLRDLGDAACRLWREPDHGFWERRGTPSRHTLSMALCATALDDLVALHDAGVIEAPSVEYRNVADAIREEVESRGFNHEIESYTDTLDSDDLDASLLTLPLFGYIPADDARMRSTFARLRERLSTGDLYYKRELKGDAPREATFGACAFWAVEVLALAGDQAAAKSAFENILQFANDVGLFAEEIDARTGESVGNVPQAFTHVALINAAATLAGRPGINED